MSAHRQEEPEIRLTATKDITAEERSRAREIVIRTLAHTPEPVLSSHVTLSRLADPAVPSPALVSIRIDLNGRPVNAHAAGPSMPAALALAEDRLKIRLERSGRTWAERPRKEARPHVQRQERT